MDKCLLTTAAVAADGHQPDLAAAPPLGPPVAGAAVAAFNTYNPNTLKKNFTTL